MQFYPDEIPIAVSMKKLAVKGNHPFQKYFCYWIAFNNIYSLIGEKKGRNVRLDTDKVNGNPKMYEIWSYKFPKVNIPSERKLIKKAINELSNETKHNLISHPNTKIFVERLPVGVEDQYDSQGQFINGVLNVTRTINGSFPVWSPIDKCAYDRYVSGDSSDRDILAEQIVIMLYVIRNNLVHGSKNPTEANDIDVVKNATPLLEIIVQSFIWG